MLHALLDLVFPPRADERAIRSLAPLAIRAHVRPMIVPVTQPPAIRLLSYGDDTVRAAIHEAKYHGSSRAFALLAAACAAFLETPSLNEYTRIHIVPVPLSRSRHKERGYNQVEEVAIRALRSLDPARFVLDASLLKRVREGPTQVSLLRAKRAFNMKGAFACLDGRSRPASDVLYIVLDDVLTTGATLGACLDALAAAGIPREQLLPVALAH